MTEDLNDKVKKGKESSEFLPFSICELVASVFCSSGDEDEDKRVRHHSVYGRLVLDGYQPKPPECKKEYPTPPKVSSAVYKPGSSD